VTETPILRRLRMGRTTQQFRLAPLRISVWKRSSGSPRQQLRSEVRGDQEKSLELLMTIVANIMPQVRNALEGALAEGTRQRRRMIQAGGARKQSAVEP